MEGDVFEVPLPVKKMKSEKAYRENQLTVIVATICALLNSDGGKLNIEFEDDAISLGDAIDGVLRMIEQRLVDIIGSCVFYTKIRIQKWNVSKQLVFTANSSQSLCTVNYNLYLPTPSQVIPISPWEPPESVKAILNREVRKQEQIDNHENFVLNRKAPFKELDSIQYKQLKDEKSKCVSLADRMTNKSNKLERYISAFANKKGGRICYGIKDDGVVKGEVVEKKDQEEITRKVTKVINKTIWSEGKLKRGKHWDIQFVPVKDENQNDITSLFVVIISVVPLRGGLFIQEPESYHVVQSRLVRMSFTEWRRRFFAEEQSSAVMDMVPSVVGRAKWSSARTQRDCHKILQSLVKYQNDGDHHVFEKFAAFAETRYQAIEVQLVILGEKSAHAYKRGQFKKAESLIAVYENVSSQKPTKDCLVFELRKAYAKSAICRAKGDYKESYRIAREGLQLAEMVPAGILVAWFYNHVAIVEKLLSQQPEKEAEKVSLVRSALDHYIKVLQHIQASSVEQQFSTTIADLQQRIHISRAITLLGGFGNAKADFNQATPSNIKAAETDLTNYHRLVIEGHSVTNYRKIYSLLATSDLRLCQWWQQQQTQDKKSSEVGEFQNFLKEAFDCATKAKDLAMKFHFEELTNYAYIRLSRITEVIIKLKVASLRLPRINNDD